MRLAPSTRSLYQLYNLLHLPALNRPAPYFFLTSLPPGTILYFDQTPQAIPKFVCTADEHYQSTAPLPSSTSILILTLLVQINLHMTCFEIKRQISLVAIFTARQVPGINY
jgi:hypothetical protein